MMSRQIKCELDTSNYALVCNHSGSDKTGSGAFFVTLISSTNVIIQPRSEAGALISKQSRDKTITIA